MSTYFDIIAYGAPSQQLDDAVVLLHNIEQLWSRFERSSEISQLNNSYGQPVTVHRLTRRLVEEMVAGWRRTQGRFDPTLLPALVDAGYRASVDDTGKVTVLPLNAEPDGNLLDAIVIEGNTISMPHNLTLDPGGIGKGLAADIVAGELLRQGTDGCMVNVGGDLCTKGACCYRWPVQIEDPFETGSVLTTLGLSNSGLATSSTQKRRWQHNGVEHHHLLDPLQRGCRHGDVASLTLIAATATEAEVYSKATLHDSAADTIAMCERLGLHALAVTHSREVLATPSLRCITTAGTSRTRTKEVLS